MRYQFPPQNLALLALLGISMTAAGTLTVIESQASAQTQPSNPSPQSGWNCPRRSQAMMQHPQANSEFEFFSLMIPHHQEAIDTAQLVLEHSDRPEMQQFARNIIAVQTAEIQQMRTWLNQWYPGQTSSLTYSPMMRDLSRLRGSDLDRIFLEDMIMHHMGAVMMAQQLVNHNLVDHAAVQPFAQNIANTQRAEIWQMRNWLATWYGENYPMGRMGGRRNHFMGSGWGGRMNPAW